VIDAVEPVLSALGTVQRCGDIGAGAAMKLVVNAAMIVSLAGLRDTLLIAEAVGVERAVALDAIRRGPLGGAVSRATRTGASFAIALAAKDLRIALRDVHGAMLADATARILHAVPDPEADVATIINSQIRSLD
jgi:3-hydroxyisobutyrate dehydrogenase